MSRTIKADARRAVFPGTFDPITRGHESLARRAAMLFDELVVGVAAGIHKKCFFSLEERLDLTTSVFRYDENIRVEPFEGLLVDFLQTQHSKTVVRGVRMVSDFEFETQLADMNKAFDQKIETIFLLPDRDYIFLSSSIVREVVGLGGDVIKFVSPIVSRRLQKKIKSRDEG